MRRCSKCELEKPLSEFYPKRKAPTSNGLASICKDCAKAGAMEWQKANPAKLNATQHRYALNHGSKRAAAAAAWYLKNKGRNNANSSAWYKKHPEAGSAKTAKYRATKHSARPKWANEFFISEAYDLAKRRTKMLGYKWHVDHTVPLKSKRVCGLHVETNLRVIPAVLNSIKGNRVWPDMP